MLRPALLLFFCLPLFLRAQSPLNLDSLRSLYPDKTQLVLENSVELSYELKGSKLKVTERGRKVIAWLSAGDPELRNEFKYYSSFEGKFNKYDITELVNNGQGFTVNKATFNDVEAASYYSYYDDIRVRGYKYRPLPSGSLTAIEYEIVISAPEFSPSLNLNPGAAEGKSEFRIIADEGVDFGWVLLGDSSNVSYRHLTQKNKNVFCWSATHNDKVYHCGTSPRLFPVVRGWTYKSKKYILYDGIKGLEKHSEKYVSHLSFDAEDKNAAQITDSLQALSKDSLDLARKLFYWVSESVKYVAIGYGNHGLMPYQPTQVLLNRYGDCKDKTALLVYLLRKTGFRAYMGLVGTRDEKAWQISELPTLSACNHMITVLQYDGKTYFLDPTSTTVAFALPTSFIQGKEVLLLQSGLENPLLKVPVIPATGNKLSVQLNLEKNGNSLTGILTMNASGYEQSVLCNELSDADFLNSLLPDFNITPLFTSSFSRDSSMQVIASVSFKKPLESGSFLFDKGILLNVIPANTFKDAKCSLRSVHMTLIEATINVRLDSGFRCSTECTSRKISSPAFEFTSSETLSKSAFVHKLMFEETAMNIPASSIKACHDKMEEIRTGYINLIEFTIL